MATGPIATFTTIVGGASYANGTYRNVALSGGNGSGAMAHITVAGGAVTAVTLPHPSNAAQLDRVGKNYAIGDVLGVNAGFDAVGSGSAFSVLVGTLALACENCLYGKIVPPSAGANLFGQRYCAKDSYLNQGRPSIGDPALARAGLFQADASAISSHSWETVICADDYYCGDGADKVSGLSFSSIVNAIPSTATIGGTGQAWTPSISSNTGTLTLAGTAFARYIQIGKLVVFNLQITITTNGTGGSTVNFTLPVVPVATPSAYSPVAYGRTDGNNMVVGRTGGASTTGVGLTLYNGAYPGADGAVITVAGSYEAA